jgi:zinc protease
MNIFRTLFAALIIAVSFSYSAAQDLNQPIPNDSLVRTGILPNGMTYYLKKNLKPEKRAELRLAVNAGAMEENDEQRGLAHFCEHMCFDGTTHFRQKEIINFLESSGVKFGADLNAYTSFDETVYKIQIPTDSEQLFKKAVEILEDWTHNVSFDSDAIEKERGIVISERRLGLGANERMREKWWPVLFHGSRYAERIPIGKLDILEHCAHSTLKQFYKTWYRPDLMALVIVGDIDLDKVEKMIKKDFSYIPSPKDEQPRVDYPVPDTKDLLVAEATDKEATNTVIQLMYKHEAEQTKTLADLRRNFIHKLYSDMFNNRLQEISKQANPPLLYSGVEIGPLVRTKDVYGAYALVNDSGTARGLETLLTENERVKRFGFTPTELDRAKKEMLRSLQHETEEMDKTDSRRFVEQYVRDFLEKQPYPGIDFEYRFFKQIEDGITLAEVNKVAANWITNDGRNAVIIITAPQKDSAILPSEQKIKDMFADISQKELKPYVDKVNNKPLMSDMPTPGKVVSEKTIKEFGITEWTLSNGVRVVLKPTDFKNDEILFNAYRWGGTSLYPDKDFESASHAASIEDESGIGDFSSTALDKMLAGKIVEVHPELSELSNGFSGKCAPEDLETAFQIINLYCTRPRKDDTAFRSYIDKQNGIIENQNAEPNKAFMDTVQLTMSRYNFRRRPLTPEILKEIDENSAFGIYKKEFSDAGGMTFFFAGNFKPDEIKPLVEKYLGSLPASKNKSMWKDLGIIPPTGLVAKTVYRGKEPKSSVLLMYTGPFEYNRHNRIEMSALSSLISIRLREQLRQVMSGVYGVFANGSVTHYPQQRYTFFIYFGCAPEKADTLINAALKVIDSVKQFGAGKINIQKIKETFEREHQVQLKENSYWLNTISQNDENGENLMEILDFDKQVESLNDNDFKRLATKYLSQTNFAKFVLMPQKQ